MRTAIDVAQEIKRGKKQAQGRRYYEANKEKSQERRRRYYKDNKEKVAEYSRRYHKDNKEKVVEYSRRYHMRRARSLTVQEHQFFSTLLGAAALKELGNKLQKGV